MDGWPPTVIVILEPPVRPIDLAGTPSPAANCSSACRFAAFTETTARDADSPKSVARGVDQRVGRSTANPIPPCVECALGERHRHAAIGTVVRRLQQAGRRRSRQQRDERALLAQIQRRAAAPARARESS